METFTPARPFTRHPGYVADRENAQRELAEEIRRGSIDAPLLPLIRECIPIPHFFTVQCCSGHFVHTLEPGTENLVPPSHYRGTIETVRYRVAYVTVCIQDTIRGREMHADLEALAAGNPAFIQFGSADWFWERMVNTYCIQLEPERLKTKDSGVIPWNEAVRLEMHREDFFRHLSAIIRKHHAYPPLQTGSGR